MNKFSEKVRNLSTRAKFAVASVGCGAVALATSITSFAEGTATADTALITGANNAVAQVQANINGVLPIALGVLGTVMAIKIGIRVFKSTTKSSAS